GAQSWHNSGASLHRTTIIRWYPSAASPAVALARLDRVAVVTSRLDAFLAFAHVDHRVDQPDARDHHENRYHQHDEIGPPAVVLALARIVRRLRIAHATTIPVRCLPRPAW